MTKSFGSTRVLRPALTLTSFALVTLAASHASASNPLEFPDNGVAQFSRGGAWLATGTDPIAAHYNPAALVTQGTGLGLGMNLVFNSMCYSRVGPDGKPETYSPASGSTNGAPYPEVCNLGSEKPRFIPNVAFAWRVSDRLALGLAIVPPSSLGATVWPYTVRGTVTLPGGTIERDIPAPERLMSLRSEGTILLPTLSVGYAIDDRLSVGLGFISGYASLALESSAMASQSAPGAGAPAQDVIDGSTHSLLQVKDSFVPGVVVSGQYAASERLDVAVWYRWLDKIRAQGTIDAWGRMYNANQSLNPHVTGECVPDLADGTETNCVGHDGARVTITVPMELRVGFRYHVPRPAPVGLERERLGTPAHPTRDPLRDDLFDAELDLSWSNNSAADQIEVRFPAQTIRIPTYADYVPANADRPTGWKDSFGARLGGQWNALRGMLGFRLGTWVETKAIDDAYLTATGVPGLRGGFGGGVVWRVQGVDVEAGYQHLWNGGLDNGGHGQLKGILGNGSPDNRTYHAVNDGHITQKADVISLGLVARF